MTRMCALGKAWIKRRIGDKINNKRNLTCIMSINNRLTEPFLKMDTYYNCDENTVGIVRTTCNFNWMVNWKKLLLYLITLQKFWYSLY